MITKTDSKVNRWGALGALDRMGFHSSKHGRSAFRSLPIMEQQILLVRAWMQKGNPEKAARCAKEVVLVVLNALYFGKFDEADALIKKSELPVKSVNEAAKGAIEKLLNTHPAEVPTGYNDSVYAASHDSPNTMNGILGINTLEAIFRAKDICKKYGLNKSDLEDVPVDNMFIQWVKSKMPLKF